MDYGEEPRTSVDEASYEGFSVMGKKSKEQHKGTCLFCGLSPPKIKMSKEHIWSDWLKNIIAKIDHRVESRVGVSAVDGKPSLINEPQKRQPGAVHRRQAKVVCVDCNGGWMKRIVDDAVQVATATILAKSFVLDPIGQRHLASWVGLSAIIADSQMKNQNKIAKNDLEYIRRNGIPPPHWSIGIGSYRGSDKVSTSHKVWADVSTDADGNRVGNFTVHTIATIMRGLYVLVQIVEPANAFEINFASEFAPYLKQIWPPTNIDISWPLPEIVTIHGNGIFNPHSSNVDNILATKTSRRLLARSQLRASFRTS